jgi:transposase
MTEWQARPLGSRAFTNYRLRMGWPRTANPRDFRFITLFQPRPERQPRSETPLSVHPGTNRVFRIGYGSHLELIESIAILSSRSIFGDDMWTTENRARYDRSRLRYPSDLTDDEWTWIRPLIPPAKRGGNKRTVVERDLLNGLMYILKTGCQWAALPRDLPPRSTVNDYFRRWTDDGTLDRLHHALYAECRERAEREASPSAAITPGVRAGSRSGPHTLTLQPAGSRGAIR